MIARGDHDATVLCLSHLAWEEGLFQRPQQVMSRLARRGYRVLYVGCTGWAKYRDLATAETQIPKVDGLRVIHVPYAAGTQRGEWVRRLWASRAIARELGKLAADKAPLVSWLYHPALTPISRRVPSSATVYDVMDCFEAFEKHGQAVSEEADLLARADLVFTGGRSLQATTAHKLAAGGAVRQPICIPSGVDLEHFGGALEPGQVPAELTTLPRPILGYFGAVDERVDFELLGMLGRSMQEASVVLIGPILVAPPELPPNVHLLGARPYGSLPHFLRAFDVGLLPFRATELVAHISPTKTPEYLAGGKAVVSTAIPDVQADYGDAVAVAHTREAFVAACRTAIDSPPSPEVQVAAARRARTWDEIADLMAARLHEVLRG